MPRPLNPNRKCARCKVAEPSPSGSYCKPCAKAYHREWADERKKEGLAVSHGGKPFEEGEDPRRNLTGRPPGVKALIVKHFGPGAELAWKKLAAVMNGQAEVVQERVLSNGEIVEIRVRPTLSEQSEAAKVAIEYLVGKPVATNVNLNAEVDPTQIDDSELRAKIGELLAKFASGQPQALPAAERTIDVPVMREESPALDPIVQA